MLKSHYDSKITISVSIFRNKNQLFFFSTNLKIKLKLNSFLVGFLYADCETSESSCGASGASAFNGFCERFVVWAGTLIAVSSGGSGFSPGGGRPFGVLGGRLSSASLHIFIFYYFKIKKKINFCFKKTVKKKNNRFLFTKKN